jgi:hypothetical protein
MNSLVLSGQERQKPSGFPPDHGLQKKNEPVVFQDQQEMGNERADSMQAWGWI